MTLNQRLYQMGSEYRANVQKKPAIKPTHVATSMNGKGC